MDLFVNVLGAVSLTGVVMTGVWGAAFGVGMPVLLLVGVWDPDGRPVAARPARQVPDEPAEGRPAA